MKQTPPKRMRPRRRIRPLLTATLLSCGLAAASGAQSDAAIYTTYEGYAANEDGTFTLVFGYHSENAVPVEIPAGPDNAFEPGEADRGQPTTFLPGRQRDVCRMVVDPDFEGNLQWSVAWAGHRNTTTEHGGLDELYLLEAIGGSYRAAREIDTTTAPRGVCVNRAPVVRLGRRLEGVVGVPLQLRSLVSDDGLPRGSSLETSWLKISGPGEVSFGDPSSPSTAARFAAPGSYELRLSAHDGAESREATVAVTIAPR